MRLSIANAQVQQLFRLYPYIWAWHKLTGSQDYYIAQLCERAQKEEAKCDAIYRGDDGWHHMSDLAADHDMRLRMEHAVELQFGKGV